MELSRGPKEEGRHKEGSPELKCISSGGNHGGDGGEVEGKEKQAMNDGERFGTRSEVNFESCEPRRWI